MTKRVPRKNPNHGPRADKLVRDALMIELASEMKIKDPNTGRSRKFRKLRLVARAWVNEAIKGNVQACEKIAERIDGKVMQQIAGPGKDGAIPIDIKNLSNAQIQQLLDRLLAGLPATGGG